MKYQMSLLFSIYNNADQRYVWQNKSAESGSESDAKSVETPPYDVYKDMDQFFSTVKKHEKYSTSTDMTLRPFKDNITSFRFQQTKDGTETYFFIERVTIPKNQVKTKVAYEASYKIRFGTIINGVEGDDDKGESLLLPMNGRGLQASKYDAEWGPDRYGEGSVIMNPAKQRALMVEAKHKFLALLQKLLTTAEESESLPSIDDGYKN